MEDKIPDYKDGLLAGEGLPWQLAKKLSELNGWSLDSGQFYYAEKEYRNTIKQAWRSGNIQGVGRLTFTVQSPDSTIFEDVSFKTADIERLLNCNLGFLWGSEHELEPILINSAQTPKPEAETALDNTPLGMVEAVKKQSEKPTTEQPKIIKNGADAVFAEFSNLRSNEVSIVMLEGQKAKIVIRRNPLTVSPAQLGLKAGAQGWKLLERAAITSGDISPALSKLNTSTDLEKEQRKIKTAVSRLREKLIKAMGLTDDPIAYQANGGYRFTFKTMTHELLSGSNVSKSADAMDYATSDYDDGRQNNGFWDDDDEAH